MAIPHFTVLLYANLAAKLFSEMNRYDPSEERIDSEFRNECEGKAVRQFSMEKLQYAAHIHKVVRH